MSLQAQTLPSEEEIVSIIERLSAREGDFTTPKSKMAFLNKLHQYQMMLAAVRDGQPEKWPEYVMQPARKSA